MEKKKDEKLSESAQKVEEFLEKQKQRSGIPFGLVGITEADMKDGTHWASGLYMRKLRGLLDLGQVVLAEAMELTQGRISQIEKEDYIPHGMRWRLWSFIFKEMDEKCEREAKERVASRTTGDSDVFGLSKMIETLGGVKSETTQLKEQVELLKEELESVKKDRDGLKKLLDLNLVDRCILLEKELIKALEANAEYVKLFALKGSAVAGDELQEQIEAKLKKGSQ